MSNLVGYAMVWVGLMLVGLAPTATAQDREVVLRGRVVLEDGSAAASVPIRLAGWSANVGRVNRYGLPKAWKDLETTSEADGSFALRFDPPQAFQFTLSIKADGLVGAYWRWGELLAGQEKDLGEIELQAGGTIVGTLVDGNGLPFLEGWSILADGPRVDGEDRNEVAVWAELDPVIGGFILRDLPPGPVRLRAQHPIANWIEGPTVTVVAGTETPAEIRYEGPDVSRRIVVIPFTDPFYIYDPEAESITLSSGTGDPLSSYLLEGSAGSYSFDELEPGTYTVSIDDPKFLPWRRSGVRPGTRVEAHLEGSAAISLAVQGPDGPIDEYGLLVRTPRGTTPREFRLSALNQPAAPAGLYRGLIPDDLTLVVEVPGYATAHHPVDGLRSGETRPVTVTLLKGAGVVASVFRADGTTPAPGVEVSWRPRGEEGDEDEDPWFDGGPGQTQDTDSAGRVGFPGLEPGAYVLTARAEGAEGVEAAFEVRSGETVQVRLVVPDTTVLTGRFQGPPGTSFAGYHLWAFAESDDISFLDAEVSSDGSYRIGPVQVGARVELRLQLPARAEVHADGSVSFVSRESIDIEPFAVPSTPEPQRDFDIRDRFPGQARVHVVVDGKAPKGLQVLFMSRSNGTERADLGADGAADVGPLLPGKWTVLVGHPEEYWAWVRPEPVEVAAGQTVDCALEVKLHRGTLRVLEADSGKPLAGRTVIFSGPMHQGRPTGMPRAQVGPDGTVEMTMAAGTYEVQDANDGKAFDWDSKISVKLEWTHEGPSLEEIRLNKCRVPSEEELRQRGW